jgi:RimJ/RimL family protein N-acetyltransferase
VKTEIETVRLVMRVHQRADYEDSCALWADEIVTRHIGGRAFTREETWSKLLRYIGHWAVLGYGYWVIHEKESNRFVGEAGFANFRRDIQPPLGDAPEGGWVLATWAHGKGFATEAMIAAHAWLEAARGKERTVCVIDADHARSVRVAEKCGYREYARAPYKDKPVILLERTSGFSAG